MYSLVNRSGWLSTHASSIRVARSRTIFNPPAVLRSRSRILLQCRWQTTDDNKSTPIRGHEIAADVESIPNDKLLHDIEAKLSVLRQRLDIDKINHEGEEGSSLGRVQELVNQISQQGKKAANHQVGLDELFGAISKHGNENGEPLIVNLSSEGGEDNFRASNGRTIRRQQLQQTLDKQKKRLAKENGNIAGEKTDSIAPAWFMEDNVVLVEDGPSRLSAGEVQFLKNAEDTIPAHEAFQHENLLELISQTIKIENGELDDISQVGPFALSLLPKPDNNTPAAYSSLSFYLDILLSVTASLSLPKTDTPVSYPSVRSNLALYAPLDGSNEYLNQVVQSVANICGADVIHIDAQDLAQLMAETSTSEVDLSHDSMHSLSFSTHKAFAENTEKEDDEGNDNGNEDADAEESLGARTSFKFPGLSHAGRPSRRFPGSLRQIPGLPFDLSKIAGISVQPVMIGAPSEMPTDISSIIGGSDMNPDGMEPRSPKRRARELLEVVLSASRVKRNMASNVAPPTTASPGKKTIICVSDFMDISSTRSGQTLMQILAEMVRKRRKDGEQIMVIGTTASEEMATRGLSNCQLDLDIESEETVYRALVIPPEQRVTESDVIADEVKEIKDEEEKDDGTSSEKDEHSAVDIWDRADKQRVSQINLRHISSMLGQLLPNISYKSRKSLCFTPEETEMHELDCRILSQTQIHHIATLTAGLYGSSHPDDPDRLMSSLKAAAYIVAESELNIDTWSPHELETEENNSDTETSATRIPSRPPLDMDAIKAKCNSHGKKLLRCVVSTTDMTTTFSQIHAPLETIDALRTLTSLSLLRPDAFKYGVLKSESIPGLMLYGPPGTGKTLMARAVAKESGATMLSVSGSEINDMYVGESEKNVRAIFSLARKLSPSVIFIDEADGLFSPRTSTGRRPAHRDTINQFLREIEHFGASDNENSGPVFLMIATNRPFDLDDAILRRVPRRLLVDLPTEDDRAKILRIHLRDEILDSSVTISDLASRTPFYSGSDLKNLCVAAALACVQEENKLAEEQKIGSQSTGSKKHNHPERRTLYPRHFETAIGEISASVSEDMSSLTSIRKFDEKYGDRKGRKTRSLLGFGQRDVKESDVRVRG